MNLFVLDTNLNVIFIVDTYSSLIWTDRYNEYGDFELYTPISKSVLDYFKQDYYLWRNDSEHTMIIEKLLINSDVEDGDKLTVTGRSLESILDRRVVWGQRTISGNLQDGIETLLNECIINPTKPERKIDNFIFERSTDPIITALTIDTQYTGDNLYDVIQGLCVSNNIGFKITINSNNKFVFKLYAGKDRSYDQFENPYVVFSPNFDNILNTNYMESKSTLKNVSLVGGEGEGSYRKYTAVGDTSGLNRREMYTDARDLSSDIDEPASESFDFTQYASKVYDSVSKSIISNGIFNSVLVDVSAHVGRVMNITIPQYSITADTPTGYATVLLDSSLNYVSTVQLWEAYSTAGKGTLQDVEFTVPEGAKYIFTSMYSEAAITAEIYSGELEDFTCNYIKLTRAEYIEQLRQRGKEDLAENVEIISFEGEADTSDRMFVYGEDFFVGDLVSVADSYGHESKARILELVTSENEDGSRTIYPTFSNMDFAEDTGQEDPDDPSITPSTNYYIPVNSSSYVTSDKKRYVAKSETPSDDGYQGAYTGPEIDSAIDKIQNMTPITQTYMDGNLV